MLNKRTILFFTDTFNKTVAENIRNEFVGNNDVASVIITKKELKSKAYNTIFNKFLPEGSLRRLFVLVNRIKIKSAKMYKTPSSKLALPTHAPIQRRMLNAINRYNPSVIVVTEQSILKDILAAVDKYEKEVKVAVLPDEFILDKRFINSAVNYYFVDNFDMRNELVDNGIADEKIAICGLPVARRYFDDCDREGAMTKFAVDKERPTVLISASRAGDKRLIKMLEELKHAELDINFIVACGKSRKMLNVARELGYSAYNDGIDMNAALNACDAVITRPTTMLMAEAIVKNKEVFALLPVGKMETATLNYLGIDLITKLNSVDDLIVKLRNFRGVYAEIRAEQDEMPPDIPKPEKKPDERSSAIIAHNLISLTTVTVAE